jgi:hypothetical protein
MATREHHPQLLVANRPLRERLVHRRGERRFGGQLTPQIRCKRACRSLPAQDVQRAVLRCHHQPGAGVFGHAPNLPDFERTAERVLDHVLGQREVVDSEQARERGNHPSGLVPEEMVVHDRWRV